MLTSSLRWYKAYLSPLVVLFFGFAMGCRFYPTCSHYTHDALNKYGILHGSIKSAWRLLRCGPWSAGGVDPVT